MSGAEWTRRSVVAGERLDEVIALYRSLGFEIRLEPLDPVVEPGCAGCAPQLAECRAVYTRPVSRRFATPGSPGGAQ